MPSLKPKLGVAGERLSKFADVWREKGPSTDLMKIIKTGHTCQSSEKPPLSMPLIWSILLTD